jgi:hypothetical protein
VRRLTVEKCVTMATNENELGNCIQSLKKILKLG